MCCGTSESTKLDFFALDDFRHMMEIHLPFPAVSGPTLPGGQGGHGPPIFDAKPNRKSVFGKFVEGDL